MTLEQAEAMFRKQGRVLAKGRKETLEGKSRSVSTLKIKIENGEQLDYVERCAAAEYGLRG